MAHLIDMTNGYASIAYAGQKPWHGLGQQVDPTADINDWQQSSGLLWHIQKRPIAYGIEQNGAIVPQTIANRYAHVRSDTQACLGIGSDKFQLVQPSEIISFYRDLLAGSNFQMETLGALNDGARLWGLAKYKDTLKLGSQDYVKPYVLLATANDGSMSTVADFTSVRVVCNNTLSFAVGNNGNKAAIRIPHTRAFNANDVRAQLGLMDDRLGTFAHDADRLTQTRISDQQAIEYFVKLYAKNDDNGNLKNERTVKNVADKLMAKYRHGPGSDLDTSRDTLWGAVNAVTNFIDFEMRARTIDNRFSSAQLGHGAVIKRKAFDQALAMAA